MKTVGHGRPIRSFRTGMNAEEVYEILGVFDVQQHHVQRRDQTAALQPR